MLVLNGSISSSRDFLVFSGTEIQSHFQWNLGDIFPNFEKKIPLFKKKKRFFFCFVFLMIGIFIQPPHTCNLLTIASYFSFNFLMAKVCVIANCFFLLTKNDIIVHYNKFPNFGVYRATFPNLKGTLKGPLPKIAKKNPCLDAFDERECHNKYFFHKSPNLPASDLCCRRHL